MFVNSCRYCRKIFHSVTKRTVCDGCMHIDNEMMDRIKAYLDLYPNSNAMQVSEGLKMDVREILRFIDEGRLHMVKGEFSKLEETK